MSAIRLPFEPRPYQRAAHAMLMVFRFLVLVWHRRAGKTVFVMVELILAALRCEKPRGRFAYIAPLLKQAKTVAWDYLKAFAMPIPGVVVNEGELSVTFPNGAQVRLYGADNPDGLRGIYLDGVVCDEVADMKPQVWGEIIRPALADRKGWAIFIGTPKGVNLFSELYQRALLELDGWKADLKRWSDTNALEQEEIDKARREMTANQFSQEFECDFAAGVVNTLLSLDVVLEAQRRTLVETDYNFAAKVLGVDVARYGDDRGCIFPRQGLAAFKPKVLQKLGTMDFAGHVAQAIDTFQPDATFVDQGAMGAGVIDRLLQLGYPIIPVDFGGAPIDPRFENRRAEMWWLMAEWCKQGSLPSDQELVAELTAPQVSYANKRGRVQLESKDDMRKRGLPSPDLGDALACTFHTPVAPKPPESRLPGYRGNQVVHDYDPYAEGSR